MKIILKHVKNTAIDIDDLRKHILCLLCGTYRLEAILDEVYDAYVRLSNDILYHGMTE